MKSLNLLSAVALAALVACTGQSDGPSGETQKLTGSVQASSFRSPVVGVRVVNDSGVVAAAPVGADGAFSLAVPKGTGYRVEVVTREGAFPLGGRGETGLRAMAFDVCSAADDFYVGGVRMYDGDWGDGGPAALWLVPVVALGRSRTVRSRFRSTGDPR